MSSPLQEPDELMTLLSFSTSESINNCVWRVFCCFTPQCIYIHLESIWVYCGTHKWLIRRYYIALWARVPIGYVQHTCKVCVSYVNCKFLRAFAFRDNDKCWWPFCCLSVQEVFEELCTSLSCPKKKEWLLFVCLCMCFHFFWGLLDDSFTRKGVSSIAGHVDIAIPVVCHITFAYPSKKFIVVVSWRPYCF